MSTENNPDFAARTQAHNVFNEAFLAQIRGEAIDSSDCLDKHVTPLEMVAVEIGKFELDEERRRAERREHWDTELSLSRIHAERAEAKRFYRNLSGLTAIVLGITMPFSARIADGESVTESAAAIIEPGAYVDFGIGLRDSLRVVVKKADDAFTEHFADES